MITGVNQVAGHDQKTDTSSSSPNSTRAMDILEAMLKIIAQNTSIKCPAIKLPPN